MCWWQAYQFSALYAPMNSFSVSPICSHSSITHAILFHVRNLDLSVPYRFLDSILVNMAPAFSYFGVSSVANTNVSTYKCWLAHNCIMLISLIIVLKGGRKRQHVHLFFFLHASGCFTKPSLLDGVGYERKSFIFKCSFCMAVLLLSVAAVMDSVA